MTDRQVGGVGARADIVPSLERQVGGSGVMLDYVPATGDVVGALGTLVDLIPTGTTRAAWLSLLVDYVPSLEPPLGELLPLVRWHAPPTAQFEISGTETPIHWQASGKTFQTALSELPLVVWNTAATRFQLPDSWEDLAYEGLGSLSYTGLEGLTYGG